ncbi:MAG: methyltransferase domain-containing protein [Acidilobus sp.]
MGGGAGGPGEADRGETSGAALRGLELFSFTPCSCVVLSPPESRRAASAEEGSTITVNAGRDVASVTRTGRIVMLSLGGDAFQVEVDVLREHSERRSYLAIEKGGRYYEVEVRSTSYYKLVPVEGSLAPTLEINGIHMHRVKGTTPLRDAMMKVKALGVRPRSRVLEVGTGLGYTSLMASRAGASVVVSIEADENVLWVAERNPWSWHLASQGFVIILGDALEVLPSLEGPFDYIIHDPPRLTSQTGQLYGRRIYEEFYRLLRPGGRIFHYTGEPGRARGRALWADVVERMQEVGFEVVGYVKDAMGVVAYRPRRP